LKRAHRLLLWSVIKGITKETEPLSTGELRRIVICLEYEYGHKGSSPKKYNSVIIYSPLCTSKIPPKGFTVCIILT